MRKLYRFCWIFRRVPLARVCRFLRISIRIYCSVSLNRFLVTLITCDIHRPLWLVRVYGKLMSSSEGTLRQGGLLSKATAINSCQKNLRLSKLSPDSTWYRKAEYSFFQVSSFDRNVFSIKQNRILYNNPFICGF